MKSMTTPVIEGLEKFLNLAGYRQTLVASNLANIDTPGFRTRDIDFETEMRRALNAHLETTLPPQVFEVQGLVERPDGNNVNLDRESLLLAQTQMQFRMGVELLRTEIQKLQTAINEGKS
jgi:flagellar basal-body rod protein FlgB